MIKVLLVDNNPVLLKAVTTILEQAGCDVESVENGLEALEKLKSYHPDILITDLIMPHVNGQQLCKIIRNTEEYNNIYIIVLSAIIHKDLDTILATVDYNLCIVKGTLKELRSCINDALRVYLSSDRDLRQILCADSVKKEDKLDPSTVTTELLMEKHHLTRMIASLSEGVLELTGEGKIVSTNGAALSLLDTVEEELLGTNICDIDYGKHSWLIKDWYENNLGHENGKTLEITVTDPLVIGEKFATASFLPIHDETSSFGVVIFRDITRQHLAEEHKRKLDSSFRLIKKMEAMSGMAGGVAHDFNNLLTVICGNLDILAFSRDDQDFAEKAAAIGQAQQAAYAAADLVRKISTFSNFGIIHREKVCVGPFISSIVKNYFKRDSTKYELDIDTPESQINIDRGQIANALKNILENSIEANGENKVVIRTSTLNFTVPQLLSGQYVPSGKFVRIDVIDQGKGIDSNKLMRVFDPYFSTKERGSSKGMGLGLTVVYSIIRNHGGYVVVQSSVNQGTSVSIFMPYLGVGAVVGKNGKSSEPGMQGNILLMEDEEPLRDIGSLMLEHLGYNVTAAPDREAAVSAFVKSKQEGQREFDFLIVNLYGENGEDGLGMAEDILAIDSSAKMIASSGAILHPVMVDCKKFGFVTTLPKPYTMDNLRHALASAKQG